jgi:very-short-patch-repair endonuclease
MDFLLLLAKRRRVVIDLDGIQHYADDEQRGRPAALPADGR